MRGFVAEVERLKIAERTVRGRRARAQAGKLLPGRAALYGYRWRDPSKSAYDIDPFSGVIVQRIFGEASDGSTIRSIASRLTTEAVPTPSGGAVWSSSTLHTILKRRAYIGEAVAWRYGSERIKGGGYRVLVRPEHEHVSLPDGTIPPLVDSDVFDAVHHRLVQNREQAVRNNRHPEETLLRGGYARCGYCGTALNAGAGKGIVYYRHGSRTRDCHGCPPVKIKAERLDADVWRRVRTILTQPEIIAAELTRLQEADPTVTDLAAIDRQVDVVARKQSNLVKRLALIEDDDMAAVVAIEVNSLAGQKRQLKGERSMIEKRHAGWRATRDQLASIETWCRRVSVNLDALAYGQKRQVLDALGVQVRLYHSNHEPRYDITASLPLERSPDSSIASTASCRCAVVRADRRILLASEFFLPALPNSTLTPRPRIPG